VKAGPYSWIDLAITVAATILLAPLLIHAIFLLFNC
jgi:hypothetical protein